MQVSLNLRSWQKIARKLYFNSNNKGIVCAATGGGKTIFALSLFADLVNKKLIIICPTTQLIDQWIINCQIFLNINRDKISNTLLKPNYITIITNKNISKYCNNVNFSEYMVILDECHHYATPSNLKWLQKLQNNVLGLSATIERKYDNFIQDILIPNVGNVIFNYTLNDAINDGVIVPFDIENYFIHPSEYEKDEIEKITKKIGRALAIDKNSDVKFLAIKKRRLINNIDKRIDIAVELVKRNNGIKKILFCESIDQSINIYNKLIESGYHCSIYHSKMSKKERLQNLNEFSIGASLSLIGCKALDEGFDIPEITLGIVVSQSKSSRQRIQRIGRTLRISNNKVRSRILTIYSDESEYKELRKETILYKFGSVKWFKT